MSTTSGPCPPVRCRFLPQMAIVLAVLAMVTGLAGQAEAKGRGARHGARSAPPADDRAAASGKIAVFAFDGDERTDVRKHVVQALSNQGLQVDTSLKPAKTVGEFRDMGATLDLVAYVHGRIKDRPGDKAEAVITVRSGVSGRPITTATIVGYRGGLRFDVEEKLWQHVGKAIVRACKEARKPRRPVHAPTHIDASGPL